MVKALFKLIKQIAVKLFKENDTQFLTIAKSMATIIAQETPTKVDDRLLRIINNNAKNIFQVMLAIRIILVQMNPIFNHLSIR